MSDPVCTAANGLIKAIDLATALKPVDLQAVESLLVTSVGLAAVLCLGGATLLLAPVIPGLGPKVDASRLESVSSGLRTIQ